MKDTLYSLSKVTRVIVGVLLLPFIGILSTVRATETDPEPPSPSVGGRTVMIINNTKYAIDVSLTMWNPHHTRGHTDLSKLVLPNKRESLGPTDGCNAGMIGTWTNSCFWGPNREIDGINSDELKITSKDFPDPNKIYNIKISKNNGKGKFALELMTDRNKNGFCKYRLLEWTAVWNENHYEITFISLEEDTNRPRSTCKK